MISDARWRDFLKYVQWRMEVILNDCYAYERGEISGNDLEACVVEFGSKLLQDVKENLEPGSTGC